MTHPRPHGGNAAIRLAAPGRRPNSVPLVAGLSLGRRCIQDEIGGA
jgi:hypothetical protein